MESGEQVEEKRSEAEVRIEQVSRREAAVQVRASCVLALRACMLACLRACVLACWRAFVRACSVRIDGALSLQHLGPSRCRVV